MSGFAEYESYDALGLAELVRQKKVTPAELLEAAIARVDARNGAVNAVTMPLYDYARKAIAQGLPGGPFGLSCEMCWPPIPRNLSPTPTKVNSVMSAAPPEAYAAPK